MVINWFKTELYLVILLSLAKTMFFVLLKKTTHNFYSLPKSVPPPFSSASEWKTIHPDAVKNFPHIPSLWKPTDSTFKTTEKPYFSPLLLFPFQSKPPITISFIKPILTVLSTLSTTCQQSTFHTVARVKAFRASTTSNHSTAFNG